MISDSVFESILDKIQKEQLHIPLIQKQMLKHLLDQTDVSTEERVKHCTESFPSPKTTLAMLLDVSTKSAKSALMLYTPLCAVYIALTIILSNRRHYFGGTLSSQTPPLD
jgi:hypothetical protein